MEKIRADLHMHGPIGFQPYWLKVQGYEGKNLLKKIADSCLDKGVNLTTITSDEDEIPRGSIHDRFNWLKDNCARSLPSGYEFDTLGKNAAVVVRRGEKLYLVNGQTVRTGSIESHVDYLVVGTNEIPNHRDLEWTARFVYEHGGCFGGAEHGLCEAHHGMGMGNMLKLLGYMTFIEGHNSQLIFKVLKRVPVFRNYRRELNELVQNFAKEIKKPWVATSDAHRIEDAGISWIAPYEEMDTSTEERIITGLRTTLILNDFAAHCEYEKTLPWINWVSKLIVGTKLGRDKI